jgi:prolyl 4-hydroxylase
MSNKRSVSFQSRVSMTTILTVVNLQGKMTLLQLAIFIWLAVIDSAVPQNELRRKPQQSVAVLSAWKGRSAFAAANGGQGFGRQRPSPTKNLLKQEDQLAVSKTSKASPAFNGEVVSRIDTNRDGGAVVLDKWGLPPITLDDVFPPLDAATSRTLVPATKDSYNLTAIQDALREYLPLGNLHRHFDGNGLELRGDEVVNDRMQLRLLHVSPPVLVIENFLSEAECREIQELALAEDTEQNSQESSPSVLQVTQSATFSRQSSGQAPLSVRTSTSWFCQYDRVSVLLAKANAILGVDPSHMEEPQIVRYRPGQEFNWHYDVVPETLLANGGQRVGTLLVYLNSVPTLAGGGTVFRDLQSPLFLGGSAMAGTTTTALEQPPLEPLTVQPVRGTALIFFPATANGQPDYRTLHKGAILQSPPLAAAKRVSKPKKMKRATSAKSALPDSYEKWIVQAWIHERRYHASLPNADNLQDSEATRTAMAEACRRLGYACAEMEK